MKVLRLFSAENNSKFNSKASKNNFGNAYFSNTDGFNSSVKYINVKKSQILKEKANECANQNNFSEAIRLYERGIVLSPDYDDLYFNLGKIYKRLGDSNKEFESYKRLLAIKPNQVEALTLAGEVCKEKGDLGLAQAFFEKAVSINPKYDYSLRNLKEIGYLKISKSNPKKAQEVLATQMTSNMANAISCIEKYFSSDFIKSLKNVEFVFGETSSVEGVSNIAQYENGIKRIKVTDDYIWAAPQVIAAYLVHESIHAKDKDAFTSIKEEQDAYRESVKFWEKHNEGIQDPELDFALSLYKKSPEALDDKVQEVYSINEDMPMYSPYHGISMRGLKKLFFKIKANFLNSNTALKNQKIISGFDLKEKTFL